MGARGAAPRLKKQTSLNLKAGRLNDEPQTADTEAARGAGSEAAEGAAASGTASGTAARGAEGKGPGEWPHVASLRQGPIHCALPRLPHAGVAVAIWAFFYFFLLRRFRASLQEDYEDQKVACFSENAFYFSFFDDFIKAPTALDGLRSLLADERSEHPTTINAWRRFNLAPELLLGVAWRLMRCLPVPLLRVVPWATAYNFYATCGTSRAKKTNRTNDVTPHTLRRTELQYFKRCWHYYQW
eukprot:GHVT01004145.1.p1 GENE.GHVT01004145.1~~GHVT01004145.1.p1  ORF type:complete len:242 (+),score=44.05 GHVT01004145.1:755-1480(+)